MLRASIDQAMELRGAGPLTTMSALQAMRDSGEEVESHADEKLLQRPEPSFACLHRKESAGIHRRMIVRACPLSGGLYCHSRGL